MFESMIWTTQIFNVNSQEIEDYNVLEYREDQIKKFKKKYPTKEEFAEAIKLELMWQYWSRSEYELIVEITEDNLVFLKPWSGCSNPEEAKINVTNRTDFNWKKFAEQQIDKQIYKNEAKIDIWSQIDFRFDEFVDYCWNYRHKWQRRKKDEI